MEDLSFRFLEPELYKRIAGMLDEKRLERERYIARAIATLTQELEAVGVKGEIYGRPKHIYSIWNKIRAQSLDFSQLYDVRALRARLAWRDEVADWASSTKRAQLDDTVYVLTRQGKVIALPAGSTPVDFAYALHSDLGHRCRGARVDGHIVPLDTPLASGQRVEIVTAKSGGPSRDWLNPERGFVKSPRPRAKIRQWFNATPHAATSAPAP